MTKKKDWTVVEIVAEWLNTNGYDGLFREEQCACLKENLAPCDEIENDCRAGYKHACNSSDSGYGFRVGSERCLEAQQPPSLRDGQGF